MGTLDALLEIVSVVGDFLIALSTYPARSAMQWWAKRFKQPYAYAISDASSSDSSSESSAIYGRVVRDQNAPTKRSLERESPSLSQSTRHGQQSRTQEGVRPSTFGSDTSSGSCKDSQNRVINDPESNVLNSSRYQVWHPPTEKPADGGGCVRPPLALVEEVTTVVHQQVDEWRQYPAFPSAYPPTPVAMTSKVLPTAFAASPSRFSPIEEEPCRQGFRKSLLPPRGPLNPSHACDLSDKPTFGISPFLSSQLTNADDSTSTDDYENEDEDDFNTTLRTPLQPQGSAKSRPHLHLFVASRSVSNSSVLSRSSALTTVDNGSPLRTTTSCEPSPSGLPFKPLLPAVVGSKRSYPHSRMLSSRHRVREVEEDSLDPDSSDISTEKFTRSSRKSSPSLQSTVGVSDVVDSTSNSGGSDTNDREQIPPEKKRRKVVRSPSTRAIKPLRRLGNRTSNYSSPTRARSRGTLAHLSQSPVVAPKRRTRRVKTANIGAPPPEPDKGSSATISEADKDNSDAPTKMTLRSRSKK